MNQKIKKEEQSNAIKEQIMQIRSELLNVNDQLSVIKQILIGRSEGGENERNKRKPRLSVFRGRK